MFKINGKRYTYDIGNKQTTEDSSYPITEDIPAITSDSDAVKLGDDISPVTKETLSSYLKKYSRGQSENLNIHPNDFPIDKNGKSIESDLRLDNSGFPAKLTEPSIDQQVFERNRNSNGLKTNYFDRGLKNLKENGFGKGLDKDSSINGNQLLKNKSGLVSNRYTTAILDNNRFTATKEFSDDFLNTSNYLAQETNVNVLVKNALDVGGVGKTELGADKNEFKSLSYDQLSIIGSRLLDGSKIGIEDIGDINGSIKLPADKIDVKKIIEDAIINSNDFDDDKFKASNSYINNETFGTLYSDSERFGDSNLNFDTNISSAALKALFILVSAVPIYLVRQFETATDSAFFKSILNESSILTDLAKIELGFHNFNQGITGIEEDLTAERLKIFKSGGADSYLNKGTLSFITNQLLHKTSKTFIFSILRDFQYRVKKVDQLIKDSLNLQGALDSGNIAAQIFKTLYFDSKMRKLAEFLIYIGILETKAETRETFDKDLKQHTIDQSRNAGPTKNGNVKDSARKYKYNNSNLPANFLIPEDFSSDLIPFNSFNTFSSNEISGSVIDSLSNIQIDQEQIPFYFHDTRTNEVIYFHAFLDNLQDSFTANYDSIESIGRIEPIRTYKDTQRKIDVGFSLFATNESDFDLMWFKINKLLTLIYPQFTYGKEIEITSKIADAKVKSKIPFSQMAYGTPIVRLRIGDYIKSNYADANLDRLFTDNLQSGFLDKKDIEESPIFKNYKKASQGLAGVIEGFNFDIQNSTWETTPGRQAPKVLKVTFSFQPIHDILPGLDHNGFNRAPVYKIGDITNSTFMLKEGERYARDRQEELTAKASRDKSNAKLEEDKKAEEAARQVSANAATLQSQILTTDIQSQSIKTYTDIIVYELSHVANKANSSLTTEQRKKRLTVLEKTYEKIIELAENKNKKGQVSYSFDKSDIQNLNKFIESIKSNIENAYGINYDASGKTNVSIFDDILIPKPPQPQNKKKAAKKTK